MTYGKPPFHRMPMAPELAPPPAAQGPTIRSIQMSRQSAFERGVLLALVVTSLDCLRQMQSMSNGPGAKWIITPSDLEDLQRTLQRMHEALLRVERIEGDA
jgi:hypothetical protein